jgi:hypothetical protein
MRKVTVSFIALTLTFSSLNFASAGEGKYPIFTKKGVHNGAYVLVTVQNLDTPGKPISVGQRFRVIGDCVIDLPSLYGKFRTYAGRPFNKSVDINGDGTVNCTLNISQEGNSKFTVSSDEPSKQFQTTSGPASFKFFDEVVRAESTAQIVAEGGASYYVDFPYTSANGELAEDTMGEDTYGVIDLFEPLPKIKNSPSKVIESDGEEESESILQLDVKKESTGSYLISVLNYRPRYDVVVKASKRNSNNILFKAKTDDDGDLTIRTKRNLKGFLLELIENGKAVESKPVTR